MSNKVSYKTVKILYTDRAHAHADIIILKLKLLVFGRATFSYSAVQPPFDIQLPLAIGLHKETSVRVSLRKLFHSRFCVQPTYGAKEFKLAHTPPSQGTNSYLGRVEPQRFIFLCPEKFQCRTRTRDPLYCSRKHYHQRAPYDAHS